MADLRNQTGETTNLVRVNGARLVYESVLEDASRALWIITPVGYCAQIVPGGIS